MPLVPAKACPIPGGAGKARRKGPAASLDWFPASATFLPALPFLVSAAVWVVLCGAIPPERQDFPLIDDWAFGRGAFRLAQGGGPDYAGWASMPLWGQWIWACPFVWVLGPSFFALRVSTVVASWIGLWAFYDLLRGSSWAAGRATLATAAPAFNPLFFLLAGTYMTDVPALAFSLVALAGYESALRSGRWPWLAGATAAAVLAAATRQNALAVSVAAGIALTRDTCKRKHLPYCIAVVLPALVGAGAHLAVQARRDIILLDPRLLAVRDLVLLAFAAVHFCGLCSLPVLLTGSSAVSPRAPGLLPCWA